METKFIDAVKEPIMGVLGIGLCFMALFLIYRAIQFKNKERLALIEKGIDPFSTVKKKNYENIKSGILLIGLAVGIIIGYITNDLAILPKSISYPSMILFFGGLALLLFYKIENKINSSKH